MDDHTDRRSENLRGALHVLRRRAGIIILCLLATPAAAFAVSESQAKQYTATASLLFRDPGFDQKLFGSQVLQPSQDPSREAATNLKLVSLDTVAVRTGRRLRGIRDIRSKVDVQQEGESNLVAVAATDRSPRTSQRIANAFASEYIRYRQEADRAKIAGAQALVQRKLNQLAPTDRGGPQARSLRSQSQQLDVLASLQTGNAELAESAATPTSP